MAKKGKTKEAVVEQMAEQAAETPAADVDPAAVGGLRGPKDVSLDAAISLKTTDNPKRPGSKAHERYALYTDGMTVKEALEAGVTTPDLVYDSAHGFIEIAGYDPKQKFVPKVREPKAPKEPKAKKSKAAAAEEEVGEEESV